MSSLISDLGKHICLNNPWEIKTKFLNDEILSVIRKEE